MVAISETLRKAQGESGRIVRRNFLDPQELQLLQSPIRSCSENGREPLLAILDEMAMAEYTQVSVDSETGRYLWHAKPGYQLRVEPLSPIPVRERRSANRIGFI